MRETMIRRLAAAACAAALALGLLPGAALAAEALPERDGPAVREESVPAEAEAPEEAELPEEAEAPEETDAPEEAAAVPRQSGTWENDFSTIPGRGTWTLETTWQTVLTINGTGTAPAPIDMPWYDQRDTIDKLVFGEGITNVYLQAYSMYKNVTSVELPGTLEYVPAYMFQGCDKLVTVKLGEGIPVLEHNCFQGTAISEITLPASLRQIDDMAFSNCSRLMNFRVADGSPYFKVEDGVLFSADGRTLAQYPSGRAGDYTVPAGVEKIGQGAFYGRNYLTGVTLPEGVVEIEENAFRGFNDQLKRVTLPESLRVIGTYAFGDCDYLESVNFPEGLETVGDGAFMSCGKLTGVRFPASLRTVGKYAFEYCDSLTEARFQEGLETIGYYAFESCDALTQMDIPWTVREIGKYALDIGSRNGGGADIYYSGTEAEWNAIPEYNDYDQTYKTPVELPDYVRLHFEPGEPGGPAEITGGTAEKNLTTGSGGSGAALDVTLRLSLSNEGLAEKITVRAAVYDRDGRFLGVRETELWARGGDREYDLGTFTFEGVRGADRSKVFLLDGESSPLWETV